MMSKLLSFQRMPVGFIARVLLAAALYLPTLDILLENTLTLRQWQVALWGLAIALLPVMMPRRGFLFVLIVTWILTPLILGFLGYIALDGLGPSFEDIEDTL